jgi:hypothetical protein
MLLAENRGERISPATVTVALEMMATMRTETMTTRPALLPYR